MYISFLLSVTFNLSESTLHVRFRASMSAKKKNTVVHYSEKLKTLFYGLVPMNFPKFLNLIYIPGHMLAWLAFAYYNTRGTLWLNRFYSSIFNTYLLLFYLLCLVLNCPVIILGKKLVLNLRLCP